MSDLHNLNIRQSARVTKQGLKDSRFRGLARAVQDRQTSVAQNARGAKHVQAMLHELLSGLKCVCLATACVLPRGILQLTHIASIGSTPGIRELESSLSDSVVESMAWAAIQREKPVAISQKLIDELGFAGVRSIAIAPLAQVIFEGYPGALLAFRGDGGDVFSAQELKLLSEAATSIGNAFLAIRQSRMNGAAPYLTPELEPARGFFVLTADGQPWIGASVYTALEESLREQLVLLAARFCAKPIGKIVSHNTSVTDSRGRRLPLRAVIQKAATLGDAGPFSHGPLVRFCFIPPTAEWKRLRVSDFEANSEIVRLIPALEFMSKDVKNQPGLISIARAVHLSPFHFHRRFTELLGITPKHFLLAAQIDQAQRLLSEAQPDLSAIARTCGFAHQSHFTSRFKQATGLTPTQWRRNTSAANPVK